MYGADIETPPAVLRLCDAIYESAGMIWSSPLYHGTISGSFKNALDWLQRLLKREPVPDGQGRRTHCEGVAGI